MLKGLWPHFVSKTTRGETCMICRKRATHRIGEEIAHDDPAQERHNWTSYVCCAHFRSLMGAAVSCPLPKPDRLWRAHPDEYRSYKDAIRFLRKQTGRHSAVPRVLDFLKSVIEAQKEVDNCWRSRGRAVTSVRRAR